ncbi:MAG: hypothetical protein IPN05_03210 [Sulfuritalea sp.]|nr:hypothetical protein [Sulfuritalea sp.]
MNCPACGPPWAAFLAALADETEVRKAAETRLGKVEKIAGADGGMWRSGSRGQIFISMMLPTSSSATCST